MTVFKSIVDYLQSHAFDNEEDCRGLEELLVKHGVLGDGQKVPITTIDAIRIKDDFATFMSSYFEMYGTR